MGRWSTSSASRLLGLLAALVLVTGLVDRAEAKRLRPGEELKVEGDDAPRWVTEPYKEDSQEAKAFCGVSHNLSSEGEAREDALKNARQQIMDAIGTAGKHVVEQVISSSGSDMGILDPAVVADDALRLVSEGDVKTRARSFHIEKWKRNDGGRMVYYYKAYVLVHWSNKDAEDAVKRSIQEAAEKKGDARQQDNIKRALDLLEEMKSEEW